MELSLALIFLLSTITCYCLYWSWSRRSIYKLGLSFPTLWGLPLLGIFLQVGTVNNLLPFLTKYWKNSKEKTFLTWLAVTPFIITIDPDVVQQILTDPDFAEKSTVFYNPLRDALKGGMMTLPDKDAKQKRKMFVPTLGLKALPNFMPIFNEKCRDFLKVLENLSQSGGEHAVVYHLRFCTLTISKETTMGHTEYKGTKELDITLRRLVTVFRQALLELILNCAHLRFLWRCNIINNWNLKKLYKFSDEIITFRAKNTKIEDLDTSRMLTHGEDKRAPRMFIDQALTYNKAGQLSWNQIIGEANAFLIASFETTSSTVYSVLVLLAMHPDVQQNVFNEICKVFPNKDLEVQYEDLKHLDYLDMIINEALRLFPPAPVIVRENFKPTTLTANGREYSLPQNMHCAIDIFHLHREPSIWGPNAHKFDPKNFLPDKVRERHPYAFIPFSKGARACIGLNYAYAAMKVLLVQTLRNYSVHTSYKYEDIKNQMTLFLMYKVEPKILFMPRP